MLCRAAACVCRTTALVSSWLKGHLCSDPPPQLFPFVNRLGHDGNRPDMLKYSVSVPSVPGSNYRDSFTAPDFSTPTLHTECLGKSPGINIVQCCERRKVGSFIKRGIV